MDDNYPFTTVRQYDGQYIPVRVDWSPNGFEQEMALGDPEDDYILAKRIAVDMAKFYGCNYKVPIHG